MGTNWQCQFGPRTGRSVVSGRQFGPSPQTQWAVVASKEPPPHGTDSASGHWHLYGPSVTSLRRGPPLPSKPEYKARLLRASPRRCADGLRIIEAQVTSPHTHTRDTPVHPRGCRLPYTKHYSHDTRGSGGAAAAAAAARAGGRVRTGRSSDRLGGRCSVLPRARRLRSSSTVRCREAWRRGETRRR